MSGIKELRDGLAKKMSAMKEKQGKSELTNPSMAEGVNEKAYGLRKKVVYGIVLFLVSAFLSFSYFCMGSDEPKEKKEKQTDQAADANNMVNSDRQLQQMNNRIKNPNGMSPGTAPPLEGGKAASGTAQNNSRGNIEAGEQGNGQRGVDNSQNASARYPVIPQRSYNGSYSRPYPVPLPINPVKQTPQPQKEKEDYSASIAFSGDYGKDKKSPSKPAETRKAGRL